MKRIIKKVLKLIFPILRTTANKILRSLYSIPYLVQTYHSKLNRGENHYTQYKLEFSPVSRYAISRFLRLEYPSKDDLIVVPTIHIKFFKNKYRSATVTDTIRLNELKDLSRYKRLLWATERCDRNALTAKYFYSNKSKLVVPLGNCGPARNWQHDQIKETVLKEEYERQTKEKIEKFDHGVGSDAGNLLQLIDNTIKLEGDLVEIGCFQGSSSCIIANYLSKIKAKKRFFVYDVFDGFNYPEAFSSKDILWKNTHATQGKEIVEKRIKTRWEGNPKDLKVFKKNIIDDDSLSEVDAISLVNIDVDLYEAVLAALNRCHPKIVRNGIIVIEDAGHTPLLLGAKLAVEEFLEKYQNAYFVMQLESGQYILLKIN